MEVLCLVEYNTCVVIVRFRVVAFGFCEVELCRGNVKLCVGRIVDDVYSNGSAG